MQQNILIIDDTKEIHALVRALLAEEPAELHSAMNGEYGLTLAMSLRPDVILLDVEMPGMTGYEVCKLLKAEPELFNIPVIFLTALSSTDDKVRGLELGAIDYITKPFSPAELLARVRVSLRSHRAIQMLENSALVDFLTGLGNRMMFKQRLAAEVSLRIRTSKPLSCIVIDIEDFQAINDTQGHPFADRVLQAVGRTLQTVCRTEDVPCRLGGDAFVVLMPNTEVDDASTLATRMQAALDALALTNDGKTISVTFNVAVAPSIDIYDRAMYDRAVEAIGEARKTGATGVTIADGRLEYAGTSGPGGYPN